MMASDANSQDWRSPEGAGSPEPSRGRAGGCAETAGDSLSGNLPVHDNLSFGVTVGTHLESGNDVFLFNSDRYKHCIILGATGSGKSNHVQQMVRQDIRAGAGVAILAAHEEDALYPLSCVPEERLEDVVFIDASNPEYLPRMNPLDVPYGREEASKAINDVLDLIAGDLPYGWFGARGEEMLRNALGLMLMEPVADAHSITEVNQMYTDDEYVVGLLKFCTDRSIYDYWTKVYPGERGSRDGGELIHWFLSKFSRITDDYALRHVFGKGKSTIDMQSVVDEGKIFVAYIPETRIGIAAARTLSRHLVLQLRKAIMNRNASQTGWKGLNYSLYEGGSARFQSGSGFDPFFVYVDEFARFASNDFGALLSESRKQHVGFVLSTQTLSQTRAFDKGAGVATTELEEAILGNVGSMICYPIGVRDAELLSRQFDVDVEKFRRIERYRPLARLCIDNQVSRPGTLEVGRRPAVDNPSAARRVASRMVESGVWVEVEDSKCKGSFLKAVGEPSVGERASRKPIANDAEPKSAIRSEAREPEAMEGLETQPTLPLDWPAAGDPNSDNPEGVTPYLALKKKLLSKLVDEYAPCLPADWVPTLEDSLKEGFESARGNYVPFIGEKIEPFAEQYMRVRAAVTVASFVWISLPDYPSADDFYFCIQSAAENALAYVGKHHEWSSFDRVLGTLPTDVAKAWDLVNDPGSLKDEVVRVFQHEGVSSADLSEDGE